MKYVSNPKHKSGPAPGRRGSICPSGINADRLLEGSVLHGNKRYATDGDQAFCGQCHDRAGDSWHGYPIDWDDVPPKILRDWLDEGAVTGRTVRQAKRRRR